MSLLMKCHSNWDVTQNGTYLKFEGHFNLNVTQILMSLYWNVTQFKMSLKLECRSNWNVTQSVMSLKLECHLNLNVTKIGILNRLQRL